MSNTAPLFAVSITAARALAPQHRLARRWAGVVAGVLLAAQLAACSTNVKLDESAALAAAPVAERQAAEVTAPPPAPAPVAAQAQPQGQAQIRAQDVAGMAASPDQRAVSGIQATATDAVQPADMPRVVYFDFDSYVVRDEFTAALEAHARYLVANTSRLLALEGHADERGGREYNLALGQKRSEAVRRVLSVLGVKESQLEAVSFGEEKPAVEGFDESAHAKNRRVELTYR